MCTTMRIRLAGVILLSLSLPGTALGADQGVVRTTLENGLRIVVVRNDLAPVVTTMVNYLVGSNEAPPGFPGMAHAQEHMMFRGSPGLSANQLADIVAAMGGKFDADTQQTVTQYFMTVPAEDLDVALKIESIRMRNVLDTQKLWSQERGAIEQEVAQDISNPEYLFYSKLLGAMFAGTPYSHDALGTRASFNQTTGAMLKKFYDTWYAPNNAILVIAGDVDPQKAIGQVKSLFGGIEHRSLPERPEVDLSPLQPKEIEMESDLPYGLAFVAYRLPGYSSEEFAAAQVLTDVLGSQRGDLYALVPQGKALDTGFEGNFLPRSALAFAVAALPQGVDPASLIPTMKKIIAAYRDNGVPADLVEAAKRREVAAAEFQKNSIPGLASEWSSALAVKGLHSPEEEVAAIKNVTVSEVNAVARKYLINETAITGVLTPHPSGQPVSTKSFGGAESFAPTQTKPVALPSWADKAVKSLEVPDWTLKPTTVHLDNGITLIVQPETISNTVSVFGQIQTNADLQTPKGQEGVAGILDDLFSYGTTSLDRLAFQKALDDIAADVSAGSSFSLEVLRPDLDRGMQLLADNLLNPALPKSAFDVVRQQTVASLAGKLQSPSYLAHETLAAALYPKGDPTLREPTHQSLEALTIEDVKSYYRTTFRPDMTTIVAIGAITPKEATALVKKYFGDWKVSGPKPDVDLPKVPLNKPKSSIVPDASRVQDNVTLEELLGISRSDSDYLALQVGNHVLGGAFYATRLYRDLRENTGLVYYVGTDLIIDKNRSRYAIAYACNPPNVSKAQDLITRDLIQMQNEDVTPDELHQAKALLLREIPLAEASVDDIAGGLLGRAVDGLPLNEPILAARKYVHITAAQVRAAFSKWIRPHDFAQVTVGPNPM